MVRVIFLLLIMVLELLSGFRVEAQPLLPPLRIVKTSPPAPSFPTRMAVDTAGNMYVIDADRNQVRVFNAEGVHQFYIGSPGTGDGQFANPTDVAVSNDGYLYVADSAYPDQMRVQKFNVETHAFVLKFGEAGRLPGQFFNQIMSLAVDSAGNVYVGSVFQLQKFDANGNLLEAFELGGILPWAMAVDQNDNLILFEADNGSFDKFNPTTRELQILFFHESCSLGDGFGCIDPDNAGPLELGDGQLAGRPGALAVDPSGNIYVTDGSNFRIQKLSPDGTFLWKFGNRGTEDGQFGGPENIGPWGLALNDAGDIYVSDPENRRIQIFAEAQPSFARCQNVTVATTVDACTAAVTSIDNGSTSPDGSPLTLTQTPAGPYPLGTTNVTLTATAGSLSDSCTATVTVEDQQVPTITCPDNQTVTSTSSSGAVVNFTTSATDNCPTLMTSCMPASGTMFAPGTTAVTCTATDGTGMQGSCGFTVEVQAQAGYTFTGFFSPVANPPAFNRSTGGKTIPMSFSLGGNYGLNVLAAGSPTSQAIDCRSGVPVPNTEERTGSTSGLTYNATNNQYTYTWKTNKGWWSGVCRQFKLVLNDGTSHTANFQFK